MSQLNEIANRFGGKIPNFQIAEIRHTNDVQPTFSVPAKGDSNFLFLRRGGNDTTAGATLQGVDNDPVYESHKEILSLWLASPNKAQFCEEYEALSEKPIYTR